MRWCCYLAVLFLLLLLGCTHKGKQESRIEEKRQERPEVSVKNSTEERDIDARILQAQEYIFRERFDEAIQLLQDLSRLDPENATVYYLLGRAYEEVGMDELSVKAYMKALQLDPDIGNKTKSNQGRLN